MDERDFLKKLQDFEDNISQQLSDLQVLCKELHNRQNEQSNVAFSRLFYQKLIISPLNICLDSQLYQLLMNDNDTFFPSLLADLRSRLLETKGYIIPPFEINLIESLEPDEIMIFIRNELVYKGIIEKTFPDPERIIVDKVEELLFNQADKIISREMIWNFVRIIEETDITLSKELMERGVSITILRQTFVNLIKERVSIKDIRLIFQKILETKFVEPSVEYLTEKIRESLSYSLLNEFLVNDKSLKVVLLSSDLEEELLEAFSKKNCYHLEMLCQMIFEGYSEVDDPDTVMLVSPKIRYNLYRQIDNFDPAITILSTNELSEEVDIEVIATIEMVKCYDLEEAEYYEFDKNTNSFINLFDDIAENENN